MSVTLPTEVRRVTEISQVSNDRYTIRACQAGRYETVTAASEVKTKQQAASVYYLPFQSEISWSNLVAPSNMADMFVTLSTDVRRVTEINKVRNDRYTIRACQTDRYETVTAASEAKTKQNKKQHQCITYLSIQRYPG
jgi:uncharacterized protein (DUF2345 family)